MRYSAPDVSGLHLKAIYQRNRVAGAEDVAVTTHDLYHDSAEWSDAEMDAAMLALSNFWGAIMTQVIAPACKLMEIRAYAGYDGDGSPGQVDRIYQDQRAGSRAGAMCPPQVACTVTEITDDRRHWGRFYIPGISSGVLAADGTLTLAAQGIIADAAEDLYVAWGSAPDAQTPVVWSRSSRPVQYLVIAPPRWRPSWMGGDPPTWSPPEALSVQAVRVDEVLDVQRPRRYESTQSRLTRQLAN